MIVRLFDRYAKLRSRFRTGRIVDDAKDMLPLLKGRLSKPDLPSAIVEPGDLEELRATLEFAAEKHVKVAVAAGLSPTSIHDLENHLLLFTSKLSQSPVISTLRHTARVSGGFPLESLAIDLARENLDWWPLYPVPNRKSIGSLIAGGWEGLRCFRRGGTLCHINFIEWMSYDGRAYATGPAISTHTSPDVSGLLFGSRGALGIITGVELSLHPAMKSRSAALLEFASANDAAQCFADLTTYSPPPETVVFWGSVATDLIRKGNDGTISDQAQFAVLVEWDFEKIALPSPWDSYAQYFDDDAQVRVLWQDVLRMPKTAARIYPGKIERQVRLAGDGIAALEEAANDFGRDANLPIALWGTPNTGYVHICAFLPNDEHVTETRANDTLNKLVEIAVSLGGSVAPGKSNIPRAHFATPETKLARDLRAQLSERCDPVTMNAPLRA